MTTETIPQDEILGTARRVGNFENGSQEWLDLRKTGIGGSDVASIVGCSPWTSPYTWWAKRTGKIVDEFKTSDAMEWGTRLESVIIDKLEESHPELAVLRDVGTFAHVERDWQLANPDAVAVDKTTGEHVIIEIKTSRFEDDWRDGVPAYYRTQVQWYMQTFGFKRAIVAVLFSGSKYVEHELLADDFEQDTNLTLVQAMVNLLDTGVEPELSAPMLSTLNTVREQHPEIDADGAVELGELATRYFDAVEAAATAEESLNEAKARVSQAMGRAKRGLLNGVWVITRQARSGGTPYLVTKKG